MSRAIARPAALALAALVVAVGLVGGAVTPAAAVDDTLGWMRLSPAAGRTDIAVDALTQGGCQRGEAVVMAITGPGIPRTGDIGYIVGNTAISALAPTQSGQLSVPLRLTFKDWFAGNAPGVKPRGTYTLRLVCRDRLRASKTYGDYVAQVAISGGRFRALGDAAPPAATPAATSPAPSGVVTPGTTAEPVPSESASPSGSGPAPGATQSAPASPDTAVVQGPEPTPVAAAAPQVGDGGGVRLVILGLISAAALAGAAVALRGRRARAGEHKGSPGPGAGP